MTKPRTLHEAIRYFSDIDVCTAFVAELRWAEGPTCDRCGGIETSYISTRRLWKCKACKRQFSVKVGTIFEDSPLGLDKWLPAVWLIANSKNGISSHELGRALGITQKSAWFMLHRIRLAMQSGSFEKSAGIVEVDETYIGGLARNMHADVRERKIIGGGPNPHMTPVAGVIERDGKVHARVVPDVTGPTLQNFVRENVEPGSAVFTDAARAYRGLRVDFTHGVVDHGLGVYVEGLVHTNTIESFWALLKRAIKGTYISVSPWQLNRYVEERAFAYNYRKSNDIGRFELALGGAAGRRLTYARLTGKS